MARMWTPGQMSESGLSFGEAEAHAVGRRDDTVATMALRRTVVATVLLYGGSVPKDRVSIDGSTISSTDLGRFVACFATLLALSYEYMMRTVGHRAFCSMGFATYVDERGMRLLDEDEEEQDILTFSADNRRHAYHDLLSRVGEFGKVTPSVFEPYTEQGRKELGDSSALYSAWYEPDLRGVPGYRMSAQPLKYVEDLLLELGKLDSNATREAWGMGAEEFVAMLGGFSEMVSNRLGDHESAKMLGLGIGGWSRIAFMSATLPFFEPELEDDGEGTLIAYATAYAAKLGFDPRELDLEGARPTFLELAVSNSKVETSDDSADPRGISIGDTRYAHLLHKFGKVYIADFFHADHWINRPLDLLAGKMRAGEPGRLKGKRVEDAVWDFMSCSQEIEPVEELRNTNLRLLPGAPKDATDIDCPLRIGDTLILGEIKGKHLGRAVEAFADPTLVKKRWKENREILDKVDAAAHALVARRNNGTFREGMKGIQRVLPVVVRPLPEWIPDLQDVHWLRKPTRTDVGIPRILAPQELRYFLESTTEEEIARLPGRYVVEVDER